LNFAVYYINTVKIELEIENLPFDFWMFFAGLGLLLFGMYHLEKGINGLAGRSFKKILRNFTDTPLKAALSGTLTTAILQSSSLVSFLIAAFLGAGIISLQNAIGVILGANIGTTASAFIVGWLGFKMNIASFSFPFLAVGTMSYLFMNERPLIKSAGSFFIGFGLIFLGIDFMKDAVSMLTHNIKFDEYAKIGLWFFIILGIVITALIQSSSAMMVMVLSALHGQIIDIHQACAIAIGSNVGTTITLVLATIQGPADKKRIAFFHVFFNFVSAIIAFLAMKIILDLIVNKIFITDPIFVVAMFNTVVNVGGVILFFPFIGYISQKLQSSFEEKEDKGQCNFINKVSTEVTDVALTALDNEIKNVFNLTKAFVFSVLLSKETDDTLIPPIDKILLKKEDPLEKYQILKKTEDEIASFYKRLQSKDLTYAESNLLAAHMIRLRSLVYAAKNMKDIVLNVQNLEESEEIIIKKLLERLRNFSVEKIEEYSAFILSENDENKTEEWHNDLDVFYHETIDFLYDNISEKQMTEISVSTLSNIIKKTTGCLEEMSNAASHENNIRESITEIYGNNRIKKN
jgi:phosphate:Na+ symporter